MHEHELKPCPFCGSENVRIAADTNKIISSPSKFGETYFYVMCRDCTANTDCGDDTTPELAAKRWNRRVPE